MIINGYHYRTEKYKTLYDFLTDCEFHESEKGFVAEVWEDERFLGTTLVDFDDLIEAIYKIYKRYEDAWRHSLQIAYGNKNSRRESVIAFINLLMSLNQNSSSITYRMIETELENIVLPPIIKAVRGEPILKEKVYIL